MDAHQTDNTKQRKQARGKSNLIDDVLTQKEIWQLNQNTNLSNFANVREDINARVNSR